MASNPIPSLETELSSNPSNCSAQVQVPSFYYYFLIHSLFGKPKKMKQAKFCVFSVLFCFWKLKGSNKGIGRDRSQVFQQWRRRFRAFKDPHFCQWLFQLQVVSTIKVDKKILIMPRYASFFSYIFGFTYLGASLSISLNKRLNYRIVAQVFIANTWISNDNRATTSA